MVSVVAILGYMLGVQIRLKDLYAFRPDVNYRCQKTQWFTLLCAVSATGCIMYDYITYSVGNVLFATLLFFTVGVVMEWGLAKINSTSIILAYVIRAFFIILISFSLAGFKGEIGISPSIIMGLYLTNCPLGVVWGKSLQFASYFKRKTVNKIPLTSSNTVPDNIIYFGHAGCKRTYNQGNRFDVTEYGILPNTNKDVTQEVQTLIEQVGQTGGGIIYFPKGRYMFGNKIRGAFLQINYSNITIEGELKVDGKPQTEFVCCSSTLKGKKNPWLSPFFITTGETLQQSNNFWGLQFKNKKNIVTRSGSLADPGSDGNILVPAYATKILATTRKGECTLIVEDARKVGKYILLGMYNTSKDGNLIKELLGTDKLRPEWKTPLRAGDETAPSYQWLVEVESILDEHTIKLVQPLWRDCDVKYMAEIYNVEMLENIIIRNICICSSWNGLFRHHGFPLYYTISQSQEMDYGWNAINMKRVAHGQVDNVIIKNFTNPLYVMDSRNLTCQNITICGHDGHQGIKIYEHACDNLFYNVTFHNHYADMLGGEGNAYGNVFSKIIYQNPFYKPVDFDFHGFSEGPMSPPANNLFDCIQGFRWIKTAAAIYNLPGCATGNVWWNIEGEGEVVESPLFICLPHVGKGKIGRFLSSVSRVIITVMQTHSISLGSMRASYNRRMDELTNMAIPVKEHQCLYHQVKLFNYNTKSRISPQLDIEIRNDNTFCNSLFDYYKEDKNN